MVRVQLRKVGKLSAGNGLQKGVIDVALVAADVEAGFVRRVQRRAFAQALNQVRVGDEQASERDKVGTALLQATNNEL